MNIAEIREAQKSLDQAVQTNSPIKVLEILERLRIGVVATESLLRETKLGISVGKLRTHTEKEVQELARSLVKKWKNDVSASKGGTAFVNTPGTNPSNTIPSTKPTVAGSNGVVTKPCSNSSSSTLNTSSKERDAKGDGIDCQLTKDKTRDQCILLVYNALSSDSLSPSDQILKRARTIEETVLKNLKNQVDGEYRKKMRSLYLNLKDKKNPSLRHAVVSGEISASRLTTMTPAEMASEERKEANKKLEEANMFNTLGAKEDKAVTDMFLCGKCKQRKVSYYQLQTRSADEPMTTFCECVHCGNRWKFC